MSSRIRDSHRAMRVLLLVLIGTLSSLAAVLTALLLFLFGDSIPGTTPIGSSSLAAAAVSATAASSASPSTSLLRSVAHLLTITRRSHTPSVCRDRRASRRREDATKGIKEAVRRVRGHY